MFNHKEINVEQDKLFPAISQTRYALWGCRPRRIAGMPLHSRVERPPERFDLGGIPRGGRAGAASGVRRIGLLLAYIPDYEHAMKQHILTSILDILKAKLQKPPRSSG